MPQHPVFTSDLPLSAVIAVIGIALPVYAFAEIPRRKQLLAQCTRVWLPRRRLSSRSTCIYTTLSTA